MNSTTEDKEMGDHADDAVNESVDDYWGFGEPCEECGGGPGWHFAGCPEAE